MKRLILYLLTICISVWGSAQTVTVISAEDGKAIPDVAVYNDSRSQFCYTGASGKASISGFTEGEYINFQHFSFELARMTMEEIRASGWTVILKTRTFEVEEFIVSANRWEQRSAEVPNMITTVSAQVIKQQNPQTTADLISLGGDIFIQKSQLGGGSPMIRGFATNRVLIVVDGVRMNNAIYREGNIQNIISIDPSAIEHTEVIFGPGAVMYGSDALGGVMDFHTLKPLYTTGDSLYYKVNALARYSTADKEKSFHLDFNLGGKRIAFLSSVSWSDFGDMKMGSWKFPEYARNEYQVRTAGGDSIVLNSDPRVQVASGYSQLNLMNKLRFRPGRYLDITLASHYSALTDVPRYDRLIQKKDGILRYGDWYYGPQVWIMNDAEIDWKKATGISDEVKITIARQDYTESRHDRKLNSTDLNEQTERVGIWSVNADAEKRLREDRGLLYYGAEYVMNNIKSAADILDISTGISIPAGSRYPNGKNLYNSISAYTGYKENFSDRLTLSTGIRYNFVSLNSVIADNSYYNFPFTEIRAANSAVTGALGLVYHPGSKCDISLNLSTGFRAPNLDDLGKVFESAPGVVVVPNPELKPEYLYNIDAGFRTEAGQLLHAEVTGFFSFLDNAMVRRPFLFNGESTIIYEGEESEVYAIVNAGYAVVYGIQAKAEIKPWTTLRIKTTLNASGGHDNDGEPLRHVPPIFGTTHIIFEKQALKADLYSVYNGSIPYSRMAPSEKDKAYLYATDSEGNPWSPGWFTLNFKASYLVTGNIELTGGVENILDQRYRPYSSGIVAAGRNFIVSLRFRL